MSAAAPGRSSRVVFVVSLIRGLDGSHGPGQAASPLDRAGGLGRLDGPVGAGLVDAQGDSDLDDRRRGCGQPAMMPAGLTVAIPTAAQTPARPPPTRAARHYRDQRTIVPRSPCAAAQPPWQDSQYRDCPSAP
jgi:hypothetical protein